jgi:hypothetical protein
MFGVPRWGIGPALPPMCHPPARPHDPAATSWSPGHPQLYGRRNAAPVPAAVIASPGKTRATVQHASARPRAARRHHRTGAPTGPGTASAGGRAARGALHARLPYGPPGSPPPAAHRPSRGPPQPVREPPSGGAGHTGMRARLVGGLPNPEMRRPGGPSVAVRGKADGGHRPVLEAWTPSAIRPWTPQHIDPQ